MSGKDTNYKERFLDLKKTLQEYEQLFANYDKQEKKRRFFWMVTLIFFYVVIPIPLVIFSGLDIIKISHDFILIYMTFIFTSTLLYFLQTFIKNFLWNLIIKNIYIYFNQSDYYVEFKIYPNVAYIVEDMKHR